jgi:hypothetical protein
MTDKWSLEKQNHHGEEISESRYPSGRVDDIMADVG